MVPHTFSVWFLVKMADWLHSNLSGRLGGRAVRPNESWTLARQTPCPEIRYPGPVMVCSAFKSNIIQCHLAWSCYPSLFIIRPHTWIDSNEIQKGILEFLDSLATFSMWFPDLVLTKRHKLSDLDRLFMISWVHVSSSICPAWKPSWALGESQCCSFASRRCRSARACHMHGQANGLQGTDVLKIKRYSDIHELNHPENGLSKVFDTISQMLLIHAEPIYSSLLFLQFLPLHLHSLPGSLKRLSAWHNGLLRSAWWAVDIPTRKHSTYTHTHILSWKMVSQHSLICHLVLPAWNQCIMPLNHASTLQGPPLWPASSANSTINLGQNGSTHKRHQELRITPGSGSQVQPRPVV